jgi:aryl-alcohol dehydrogenase-like predicted oxidoreductase
VDPPHPAITGAIVGARSAGQEDGFAGALDFRLNDEDLAVIEPALPESMRII